MRYVGALSKSNRVAFSFAALAALTTAAAGCGGKPALATVTGKVTHAGQPVAGAIVMFQPEKGVASGATTGADGRFELQTPTDRRPGAIPGKHLVCILKPATEPPPPEGGSPTPPPPTPPLEFNTTVEVKAAEANDFVFDIPQKPGG